MTPKPHAIGVPTRMSLTRRSGARCNVLHSLAKSSYIIRQVRRARSTVSEASSDTILPPDLDFGSRPRSQRSHRKFILAHRTYFHDVLLADFQGQAKYAVLGVVGNDWWSQCGERLQQQSHRAGMTSVQFWGMLRFGCMMAMREGTDSKEDADDRITCAQQRILDFLPIYRTVHQQADALYILGRTEIERNPRFHKLGWYILRIAAEMGQLDAGLLLHRFERVNSSLTAGTKARSIIHRAAKNVSDWRAVMAYAEMEVYDKPEGKRSLQSTVQTVLLLRRLLLGNIQPRSEVTAGQDLPPVLHPDVLEEYPPACRYFWRIVGMDRDRLFFHLESQGFAKSSLWSEYVAAIYEDAVQHHNPRAKYEMTKFPHHLGYKESCPGTWQRRQMLTDASLTIPEASYVLAKEMCKESSLLPTLRAKERLAPQPSTIQLPEIKSTQEKSVQQILKTAGLYHLKDAIVESYLYLLGAGLLNDNGKPREGKAVIETAISAVQETIAVTGKEDRVWVELFEGLLQRWTSYSAKGLYVDVRPEEVIKSLDLIILGEGWKKAV